jgi:acetyl esterase/lipase
MVASRMRLRPSRVIAVLIIMAMVGLVCSVEPIVRGALNAPGYVGSYQRHADVRYGNEPRQSLDIYVPAQASAAELRPIVVFWYGGFWTKGRKEDYRFVAAALANAGYVAILPDYRLFPQVHFPKFVEDGALAVKWAQEHAAEYGGDSSSLFLMGHSAGAHIAALVALDRRYLVAAGADPDRLLGWIGVSGPYALDIDMPGRPILRKLFVAPHSPQDWQVIELAGEHSPRTLLLHGTFDIYPQHVLALEEKLLAAGRHVECHIYKDVGHTETITAFSWPLRATAPSLSDVRRFIDRSVASARDPSAPDSNIPCPRFARNY